MKLTGDENISSTVDSANNLIKPIFIKEIAELPPPLILGDAASCHLIFAAAETAKDSNLRRILIICWKNHVCIVCICLMLSSLCLLACLACSFV